MKREGKGRKRERKQHCEPRMVTYTYNLHIVGGLGVQGYPQLHIKFDDSLNYMSWSHNKTIKPASIKCFGAHL